MKATFVGGGAQRLIGVLRRALAEPGLLAGGEVHLHDLDGTRAEAVGRMVMKTPEYAEVGCRITWGTSLEQALEGADAVGVILMAGSRRSFELGTPPSLRHGFLSSDNVSPNGAFLAVKGARLLLNLAREMERRCPDAWLLDFANPVAVFSALVNNHTKIKALGVCGGYTNHQWDLTRLLGRDEEEAGYCVAVAGVNHLSFILKGSLRGEDLFELLDRHLTPHWQPPRLHGWWSAVTKKNIRRGLRKMVEVYHKLGVLVFSTELDGMSHLFYDEALALARREQPMLTQWRLEAGLRAFARQRAAADERLRLLVNQDLDERFWITSGESDWAFRRPADDIFVRALTGIAGLRPTSLVASTPSRGAVEGLKDRNVVEYSQIIHGTTLKPAGQYALPDSVHGLIDALATHQTLLADAIAAEDPRLLAQAMLAYPVQPYSRAGKALCRELLKINEQEIPPPLRQTSEYL